MFGQGFLTKIGVTEGLKALGVEAKTAKNIGGGAGWAVTICTFDLPSGVAEGIAEGAASMATDCASDA